MKKCVLLTILFIGLPCLAFSNQSQIKTINSFLWNTPLSFERRGEPQIGGQDDSLAILPRSAWGADTPKPFAYHVPNRITVHHEGTFFDGVKETAEAHILKVQKWGMTEARNWIDIPYHFLIDNKGRIFEGRNPYTVGETNTDYNPEGHLLISMLGNFEEQEVPPAQLEALINMIVYACKTYSIDPNTLATHKDQTETLCPGKNLYAYFSNGYVLSEVKKRLSAEKK
ncbi:MAG: N-acetylmuramoyl-L-alanine amidase [Ignavibacteriales bacterium]|nr:N-acetylmuramoyl-L-alanine amidase [Ignavibacteriales bacterium]